MNDLEISYLVAGAKFVLCLRGFLFRVQKDGYWDEDEEGNAKYVNLDREYYIQEGARGQVRTERKALAFSGEMTQEKIAMFLRCFNKENVDVYSLPVGKKDGNTLILTWEEGKCLAPVAE